MSAYLSPVWFNGELIETPFIAIDPADRGFLLGDGAFETIAVVNGKGFRVDAHIDRLLHASEVLGLGLNRRDIENAVAALLQRFAGQAGILRITATRGAAGRGLATQGKPSLLLAMAAWPPLAWSEPVRLATASVRRNEQSPVSRLKTLSYLDNILAAREAAAQGADDALLLNTKGRAACSTIANLFIVSNGKLATPPLSEGVLPGITRRIILEIADRAEERLIDPVELRSADEVFLSNSIRLVRPVSAVDGRPITSSGFPVTMRLLERLQAAMAAACGARLPGA